MNPYTYTTPNIVTKIRYNESDTNLDLVKLLKQFDEYTCPHCKEICKITRTTIMNFLSSGTTYNSNTYTCAKSNYVLKHPTNNCQLNNFLENNNWGIFDIIDFENKLNDFFNSEQYHKQLKLEILKAL